MVSKRSRFKRSTSASLALTDRDVEILLALEQHRFLTTDHLLQLTGTTSRQAMNRRLRRLYDAKYIDRPRAQMHAMACGDKRPMIYALGNDGAALLSNRFQMALPDIYWTEKNRRVKEKFVEHTLGIADFMVGMEVACRQSGRLKLIHRDEILASAPEATRRKRDPFRWQTRIHWDNQWHEIAIVPDAVFGLQYLDKPEGMNRAYFFVEIDRGTMPILRRDIRQSSFARKLHSYADTFDRKLHTDQLAIKNFRLLTVTTSADRIATMCQAVQTETTDKAPPGLFLFRSKTDPSGILKWRNASGAPVDLAD